MDAEAKASLVRHPKEQLKGDGEVAQLPSQPEFQVHARSPRCGDSVGILGVQTLQVKSEGHDGRWAISNSLLVTRSSRCLKILTLETVPSLLSSQVRDASPLNTART